jgi:hypothetical protein
MMHFTSANSQAKTNFGTPWSQGDHSYTIKRNLHRRKVKHKKDQSKRQGRHNQTPIQLFSQGGKTGKQAHGTLSS